MGFLTIFGLMLLKINHLKESVSILQAMHLHVYTSKQKIFMITCLFKSIKHRTLINIIAKMYLKCGNFLPNIYHIKFMHESHHRIYYVVMRFTSTASGLHCLLYNKLFIGANCQMIDLLKVSPCRSRI